MTRRVKHMNTNSNNHKLINTIFFLFLLDVKKLDSIEHWCKLNWIYDYFWEYDFVVFFITWMPNRLKLSCTIIFLSCIQQYSLQHITNNFWNLSHDLFLPIIWSFLPKHKIHIIQHTLNIKNHDTTLCDRNFILMEVKVYLNTNTMCN